MATWRDIPTLDDWKKIYLSCTHVKNPNEEKYFDQLSNLIGQYHQLVKTDVNTVKVRIQILQAIASMAIKYKEERGDLFVRKNDINRKHLFSHIDLWIEHLIKQCNKKAIYLQSIEAIHDSYSTPAKIQDKLNKIRSKNEKDNEFIRLQGGSFLEKLDPAHRDFEFSLDDVDFQNPQLCFNANKKISNDLFYRYLKSGQQNSFFMWLEGISYTTTTPKINDCWNELFRKTNKVNYTLKDKKILLASSSEKKLIDANANVFNSKLMPNQSHKFGSLPGMIAFIWDKDDENKFVTHSHWAGKYHHSSLVQGEKIRCAGMWIVEEGKVTAINSSSGHYKPSSLHFYKLIQFLLKQNLLANDVVIADMKRPIEPLDPKFPGGPDRSRYYSLAEYVAWAESLPEIENYLQELNQNATHRIMQ